MDLTGAKWHTSSRSSGNGECVEVADNLLDGVAVRDTKDRAAGTLIFPRGAWAAFIENTKAGQFDL
ncbi:DUF397 domain-containing protein [Actinoplanes sp. TFC3]|uniref:DUF397 domain-containing protein n=1 Tax=Actinoplanes sp. TFC3 TaxID=1710355 RepID=UPI00082E2D30|nr:DUF397 domain-containing protein [Actinoplanes sp. TFC3]